MPVLRVSARTRAVLAFAGLLVLLALCAGGAAAATVSGVEAESMALDPAAGTVFADPTASGGKALLLWSDATATATVTTAEARAIRVRARGDQCGGAPELRVAIDGQTLLDRAVSATRWTTYEADVVVPAGTHSLAISYPNDAVGPGCDRNLRVDSVSFAAPGYEAESMSLPANEGVVFPDSSASGGKGLVLWSKGSASLRFSSGPVRSIAVVARGDQCHGAPLLRLAVDGRTVLRQAVAATSWATYAANVAFAPGPHRLSVAFPNDALGGGCDRNLRLDRIVPSPVAAAPFARSRFYVDPDSNARRQADALRASDPAAAAALAKIAAQPQADWFGGWSGDVRAAVAARVAAVARTHAVPVLVAYDIPDRDCGGASAGGAASPEAYRAWIRAFAAGIGGRPAAVVLEPDALAGLDCLAPQDQQTRLALLRDAVAVLTAHPRVSVYLDAGNPGWHSPGDIAARLLQAGVEQAQGFALNVSNFVPTSDDRSFGDQVSALTGGAHFVVDTSRNGLGPAPDGSTCNPAGRALGNRPTAATGDPLLDAYLWIKRPGESDGSCNGGPLAGAWWTDYAVGLARRARW